MTMSYDMMHGASGGGWMTLGWVLYILTIIVLVLGTAALWKYLTKK